MSPLAHQIYALLRTHLADGGAATESLTYGALARALGVRVRSGTFYDALGELTKACRAASLPALPALVGRTDTLRPGDGYYPVAHPRVRSEAGRQRAWLAERAAVIAARTRYPKQLRAARG